MWRPPSSSGTDVHEPEKPAFDIPSSPLPEDPFAGVPVSTNERGDRAADLGIG
jgi:hypothetical protein